MRDRIYYSSEAQRRAQLQQTRTAIMMIVVGMGIGAVVAILMAPQKGEDTRDDISEEADRILRDGRGTANDILETLRREFSGLRDEVESRLQQAQK